MSTEDTAPSESEAADATLPEEAVPKLEGDRTGLLDVLLYEGVLPRYAFPTDVASFYVFDVVQSVAKRPVFRHSPQQGLSVALSQYAPGKEVWIASQKYVSGAIYSPFRDERKAAWDNRCLYYECSSCGYTETRTLTTGERSEVLQCPACPSVETLGPARLWFRPPGFAHPADIQPSTSVEDLPANSRPTRARLEAPSSPPSDPGWKSAAERISTFFTRDKLLVTNTGPGRDGYRYCASCGRIEPAATRNSRLSGTHKKPYPDPKHPDCEGKAYKEICLGTSYVTDILLIQFNPSAPVRLLPGVFGTAVALRTLCEALSLAACQVLEVEAGEVIAEYRPAVSPEGKSGSQAELFLYDSLPGGAGFSRAAGERMADVLAATSKLLQNCDCDASCYKCLRSFKNRFDHSRLHRHVAAELLEHLCVGTVPSLPAKRLERAVFMLAEDIARQAGDRVSVQPFSRFDSEIGEITVPLLLKRDGLRRAVCITHALSPDVPSEPQLHELAQMSTLPVICVHELRILRALPQVSEALLGSLGVVV